MIQIIILFEKSIGTKVGFELYAAMDKNINLMKQGNSGVKRNTYKIK